MAAAGSGASARVGSLNITRIAVRLASQVRVRASELCLQLWLLSLGLKTPFVTVSGAKSLLLISVVHSHDIPA